MLSLYHPADSFVHRAPAPLKLALLCAGGTAAMIIPAWLPLALGLALILALFPLAHLPARVVWPLTRAALVIVGLVAACQCFFAGPGPAVLVALRLLWLITAANLVTLTTRITDLVATVGQVLRPLARFGVDPDRIGLAIALALRFIPVITEQGRRIREAQTARGVHAPLTYLAPLIIRTLRLADGVGQALEARGWGLEAAPAKGPVDSRRRKSLK